MNKVLAVGLAVSALVLTGCPRNEYIVELTPHGEKIERKLTFYRADGTNANGYPDYSVFPADEFAEISKVYPEAHLSDKNSRHVATLEFGNAMPPDVGGSGSYTNITTSLGNFGFYAERFRGETDLAAQLERRLAATDRFVDYAIGWATQELKQEKGFENLRQFLDTDFRKDMKNLCLYAAQSAFTSAYRTNMLEEYTVRFGQYLMDRGYFTFAQLPIVANGLFVDYDKALLELIQRLVARKMGIPDSEPIPKSLAFLTDDKLFEDSCSRYLERTEIYNRALKEWEQARKINPALEKPKASEVTANSVRDMADIEILFWPEPKDHLTVKLSLPDEPVNTNGKWDEDTRAVTWEAEMDNRTNAVRMPVFCYASWGQPDEAFQRKHFGEVLLSGERLGLYCVWRASLSETRAVEWEAFLNTLNPGKDFEKKVAAFHFSGDPQPEKTRTIPPGPPSYAERWLHKVEEPKGGKK